MSFGLLFSGQGTQYATMLPWLDDADPLVQHTQRALGIPCWRQALQDPAWGARNRNVQVLLTGIGLAAWSRLAAHLPAPAAVAGYSVGELAAFGAAGVFDAHTAISLASQRADAMDRAAVSSPGGLLAVTGMRSASVDAVCRQVGAAVAIRIDADVTVIGGSSPALEAATTHATSKGARCTRLNIEVASHTAAMLPAVSEFACILDQVALSAPSVPLFANLSGERVYDARQLARALAQQIAHTVQWADCLDSLHARRLHCVLEIGPGSALSAMWNQRYLDLDVPARSADEFRSMNAVVEWMQRRLAQ